MSKRQIIEPELTWTGAGFERGVRLVLEPDGSLGSLDGIGDAPAR